MELFLLCLVVAAIVSAYANSKGHDEFGTFWPFRFLSPLIVLVIRAVGSPSRGLSDAKAVGADDTRKCSACAEAVKAAAMKCCHCGEIFAASSPDRMSAEEETGG